MEVSYELSQTTAITSGTNKHVQKHVRPFNDAPSSSNWLKDLLTRAT